MDPNKNNTQQNTNSTVPPMQSEQSIPQTTPQTAQPTSDSQVNPAESQPTTNKSNKMIFMFIILVILLVVFGILYFMMGTNKQAVEPTPTPVPTVAISPAPAVINDETEVDNVIINDPETDFIDVDKDLQQL